MNMAKHPADLKNDMLLTHEYTTSPDGEVAIPINEVEDPDKVDFWNIVAG